MREDVVNANHEDVVPCSRRVPEGRAEAVNTVMDTG